MERVTYPTWGYREDGQSRVFELASPNDDLPKGWSKDPNVIKDPAKRSADAVSGVAAQHRQPPTPDPAKEPAKAAAE